MNAAQPSGLATADFSLQESAWEQVSRWSEICQRFLDWQQREILRQRKPAADKIEQHGTALKWLLRFGRAIYLTASDPDYPDKRIASELRGRLVQLEHSWRMVHEQVPEGEATQVLREVFPG
ncbi:MAG: hypothetical protein C5B50_08175 [Verrucomicrobia bacterium]|nr:MAG: hypothetical protein C5B50_08175 [Verrucomicrobiota bacterium]